MAGTTTNFAIPYPSITDYVTDGATAMKSIADKVDDVLFAQVANNNLLINGAMQVSQRSAVGTAVTGITGINYYTADRWGTNISSFGTWSQTTIADAPTGSGFRNSLKMACTTINASPAAGAYHFISQKIEGQNLQALRKGTSSAQTLTLSFWVKSFQTGTFICELSDYPNNRVVSKAYTITASATWQYVSIAFPADITGSITNDNTTGIEVNFWLGAGTNYSSGTLQTTWATRTDANRAVGQTNVASSTNNYWQITGAQLTIGSAVVPFQFQPYNAILQACQRYYEKSYAEGTAPGTATFTRLVTMTGSAGSATTGEIIGNYYWAVVKRTSPTVAWYDHSGNSNRVTRLQYGVANHANNVASAGTVTERMAVVSSTSGNTAQSLQFHFVADVEL